MQRNISPELGRLRARVATLSKYRRPSDPELIAAAQELKTVKIQEFIARAMAKDPDLTPAQVARVTAAFARTAE